MSIKEDQYYSIKDFQKDIVDFRISRTAINDVHYFSDVYVNPRALLSMMKHSLTSKNEIIGLLLGHFDSKQHLYYITDTIMFPIAGKSYKVDVDNASLAKGNQRIVSLNQYGRPEDYTGWYHSHPNLHCFFSMIDVRQHRMHWGAKGGCYAGLVIDPINTMVSAHLHLGAYSIRDPEEAKKRPPPTSAEIKKYGTAANEYYQLDIHYFCSEIDKAVLNDFISKSYGTALQSSPLSANSKYLIDSMEKSKQNIKPGEDKDPLELKDQISSINTERKTGLWVHRKKRVVFG